MLIMLHLFLCILGFLMLTECVLQQLHIRNIRKNGAMPADSVGKKLYAAVAFHT